MNALWIVHGFGAFVSIVFIVLSIYAACRTSYFSLPIPPLATFLVILASLITYPLLVVARYLHFSSKSWQQAFWARIIPHVLLALNTILITLSVDRVASPSFQSCSLREQWLQLFQAKNVRAIRRIQDSMNCCGFRTSRDMAWPFPDNSHGSDSCEIAFGRTVGCEGPWTAEGRGIMAIMVVVGSVGVVSVLLSIPTIWEFRTAWFRQTATHHPQGISNQVERPQRLLTDNAGMDETEPYEDDPEEGHAAQQQSQRGENGTGRSDM